MTDSNNEHHHNRDFHRVARRGLLVCIVFVGGFFTWSALAPLGSAVVAPGIVKIWTHRKTIQHLDGGIVQAIYVADGSLVQEGDPLILLEDTTTSAALNILTDQQNALTIQEQRLLAEQSLSKAFKLPEPLQSSPDPKIKALYASELSLFEARRNNLNDQIDLLRDGIIQAQAAVTSASAEIRAIEEGLEYTSELVDTTETMAEKGFVERAMLLEKREALAEKKERLHAQTARLAELRKQIVDQKLRIIALRNAYMEEAEEARKQTREQLVEIEERLRPARIAQERTLLTAPITGQVMELKVTTIGGVIRPGEPLLDIVPQDNELIVEVKVSNQDIDNVYVGQPADVQLNAFNRRTTPLVDGQVIYVAGDAVEEAGRPGVLYFMSHISLDQEQLTRLADIALTPGMPVTAFIKTQTRTLLDYLTSPLTDHWRRALRED
ncbi:HlyD family type I secretion periplasmic adaptor subunit [Rhabdochromatium marinum]|uniref:HlyD family type I secretion periplasmic adaptor subunit n=1 Tax=Rhabdochromatium marinum TaxID=48729 RepID=UPI00190348FD|nr:HlyD family type I secretion periplasmic adaptor subunit [Rhabdochromatium marinum]MBK1648042.1 hypothetical protein [Rhabdochromatium marinum]